MIPLVPVAKAVLQSPTGRRITIMAVSATVSAITRKDTGITGHGGQTGVFDNGGNWKY
jgi:hypothetical protein